MPVLLILLCLVGLALCGLTFYVFAGAWTTTVLLAGLAVLTVLELIRGRRARRRP